MAPKLRPEQEDHPRILLLEANDMPKWVGGSVPFQVHIPPIGLMYLAAYGRQAVPGSSFVIAETSLQATTDEELTRLLEESSPHIVGIRCINFFSEELQRVVRLTKEHSSALVVVGGPIVASLGARLLQEVPEIDVAVRGEGEQSFAQILAGKPYCEIGNLLVRSNGGIVETPEQREIEDIDSIPFPAYDLVDLGLYERQLSYTYNQRRQAVLLTGRGCPYHCSFCFKHWKKTRLRSAENVFREISQLKRNQGISDFYIIDDIFNLDRERALKIFNLICEHNLEINLYFANGLRTDRVDRQFVDRAIEAGAIWFTYAIETANSEIQRLIRKPIDLPKAADIISYTQDRGVAVNVTTMFGFPGETPEAARETLDWLSVLRKPPLLPYHFCLRLFAGAEIIRQAQMAGWDISKYEVSGILSYNDFPLGTPTFPRTNMVKMLSEYHQRFGLKNQEALSESIRILRNIGYSDAEVIGMYSVLKATPLRSVDQILGTESGQAGA